MADFTSYEIRRAGTWIKAFDRCVMNYDARFLRRRILKTEKNLNEAKAKQEFEKRIKEKVAECEKFAEESPFPELNVMYDSVYEQKDYPFLEHKL